MKQFMNLALVAAFVAVGASDTMAGTATTLGAGYRYTCAVTTGGGVECWGANRYGQLGDGTQTTRTTPTAVIGLSSSAEAVAAGMDHTCALTTDGGVVCWGDNYYGQLGDGTTTTRSTPTPVSGLSSGVTILAAGWFHTCAMTTSGGVVCWGRNTDGQLGDGTTTTRTTPTAVSGLSTGITTIAAGNMHTCAATLVGGVVCWGYNTSGQLGDGTQTTRTTPTVVIGLSIAGAAIAAGQNHTCALTTSGGVLCWGNNGYGQLGDGTTTPRMTPTPVSGLSSGVTTISGGEQCTCALTTGGGVLCWGQNSYYGQLGDGTTTNRSTPTAVIGLSSGVAAVAAGSGHTCAVTTGGGVVCWGANTYRQLGDGVTKTRTTPTPVSVLSSGIAAIAAGYLHTYAVTTSGARVGWGYNLNGELGNGTTTIRSTPEVLNDVHVGVAAAAAGHGHTCVLTTSGGVLCWGYNGAGQLGDGTTTNRLTPTAVSGLSSGVAAIAAGGDQTCALTSGGGVLCWGYNGAGQLGDGTTTNRSTPTAVIGLSSGVAAITSGYYHTCAVTTGGGVVCWGRNTDGQLGDGTTTDQLTPTAVSGLAGGVAAIAAGNQHTCALTTGGGVVCWGNNGSGRLGDGTQTSRTTPTPASGLSTGVTAITAGFFHTCAVTTNGGVVCWGDNLNGKLGDGTTWSRLTPTAVIGLSSGVAAVAAGQEHTCALTIAGGVLCWGDDSFGQLGLGSRSFSVLPLSVYGFGGAIGVSAISPASGPASGGTAVTISGAYILEGATVTIGGTPATSVTVRNTETITATTGVHAAGRVSVVVTNPDTTQATLTIGFLYAGAGVDFTGDLTSDILWRNIAQGDIWLWPMANGAKAGDAYVGVVTDTNWEIRGQGDLDGDGTADLLWRHKTDGTIYYWKMNAGAPAAELYVATVDVSYDIVGTGDFDGDGKADILWRNPALGDLWLWRMNGAEVLSQTYIDTVDLGYAIKGLGDLNGDTKTDLVWAGTAGDIWLWQMNGAARDALAYVGTVADAHYQIQQVADFDGLGKADLLWWNTVQGDVWIWSMNGATVVSEDYVGVVPDTNYRIMAAGDYNGDTKADILWRNVAQGDVWVWLMNGPVKESEACVGLVADQGYQIVKVK